MTIKYADADTEFIDIKMLLASHSNLMAVSPSV